MIYPIILQFISVWVLSCLDDLKTLEIAFEGIKDLSKKKFKKIVKQAMKKSAYNYLIAEKEKLSKVIFFMQS